LIEKDKVMERPVIVLILIAIIRIISSTDASASETDTYKMFSLGLESEQSLMVFEAKNYFKNTLEIEPNNQGYLTHYAWFLASYGFSEEAADVFKKLLPLSKDQRSVYSGLGWTNQQLGRLDDSLSAYKNCFLITSSDIKIAFEQIQLELSKENEAKITALLNQIASQTNLVQDQRTLIKTYIDNGDLPNAVKVSESLRKEGALDMVTHLWFARALLWMGLELRAETEYNELIVQSPRSAFLYMELAGLLESENRLYDAKLALEKALTLYPESVQVRKKLAEIYARTGCYNEAENMANSIQDRGLDRLLGMMARARAFHFSGLLEDAHSIYTQILDEYPYYPDALWGMSETSIYTGKYTDAFRIIKRWEDTISDSRLEAQKRLLSLYFAPNAKMKMDYYYNSSNFSRINAGSEFNFYPADVLCLNLGYHYSKFSQDGFSDVNRHSAFLSGEMYFSPTIKLDGRLAGNIYDNDNESLDTDVGATFRISPKLSAKPYFRHFDIIDTIQPFENAMYNYVVTIGSVGMGITSNEYGLKLNFEPSSRLSFSSDYAYGKYSDDNKKQCLTIGAEYKLALQPDFRIGYNYFYLDFKDPAPVYGEGSHVESAYFDPINFENHTLRLSYQHQNGDGLSYGGEGSLSFMPKNHGIGTLLSSFADWKLTKRFALRLDVRWFNSNRGIDRIGDTGSFRADNILLTFNYRF
jgi:tetratricopeptide (TPR) repeat protein